MNGILELAFDATGAAGATRLAKLFQAAPLRALFPETCGMDLPVAALTATCGGFTGGDRMKIGISVGPDAQAMAVAQAAEKLYRAGSDETRIEIALEAAAGSWLEWLPQETILFNGARLRRDNRIDIHADAAVLAGEILVFGRSASGETLDHGLVHDAWSVRRDGRLIWSDRCHAEDDVLRTALSHAAGLDGAKAAAMLVHAGPDAAGHLELARSLANAAPSDLRCGATLVNGVLVMRWLAPEAHLLRSSFAAAWVAMRAAARSLSPRLPSFWLH